MTLRFAVLCDYASVSKDGKLNVLGIFDRIFAVNYPAVHRELVLVTSMESDPEDEGVQHHLVIQLVDMDGKPVTRLEGQLTFGHGKQIVNQLHQFHDLRFESEGSYQFDISLDGHPIRSIGLDLVRVDPPAGTNRR